MSSKIRIAVAQMLIQDEREDNEFDGTCAPFPAIQSNLQNVAALAAEAAQAGADVLVCPEFCVQGIAKDMWYLAWVGDYILEFLGAVATQHKIAICGSVLTGTMPPELDIAPLPALPFDHLLHAPNSATNGSANGAANGNGASPAEAWAAWVRAYRAAVPSDFHPAVKNTAFFIDDTGSVIGRYDKKNLWHPERDYVTAGDEFCTVFQTKWGKAGMMICWDLSHSSAAQALSDQHVDMVFVPAYWKATDPEPWLSNHEHEPDYEANLVQAWMFGRAVETESVWVLSNAGGPEAEGFMGISGVWAPLRGRVGGFNRAETGLKFADVDLPSVLADTKAAYKIREDYAKCQ